MRHPDKPTVPEVCKLVEDWYSIPGNEAGGVLHVILEDGNMENSHIRHYLDRLRQPNDAQAIEICNKLIKMSRSQRRRLLRRPFRK